MSGKRSYYADAQAFLGFPMQPPKIEEGLQLDLALVTCAPPAGPCAESLGMTLEAVREFRHLLFMEKKVNITTKVADLDPDDERLNVVLGLQNLPSDVNAEFSDADFVKLWKAGVRVIALAYDGKNQFGSGCLNLDIGLTEKGKRAILRMSATGFILDLSHASHRMAREALKFIEKENLSIPVMASHGGCYSIYPHFRNLPDDVLAGIAKWGGVVGIYNLTFGLHQKKDNDSEFYNHLSHAMNICGEDAIVIGSDAPYTTYTAQEEQELFGKMQSMIDPNGTWGSRYPMYTPQLAGPGKISILDEPSRFFGFPDGFLGSNLLNFFKRSLPR